uniref:Uncharacterized protein n=1 Tax=Triticum urartu TaxID=4572 RepID=A0A8R7PE25_TRIUA
RECFGQKNKTLGAIFKQKRKILDLLKRSQRSERCTSDAPGIILGVLDGDGNDEACSDEDGDSSWFQHGRGRGFQGKDCRCFRVHRTRWEEAVQDVKRRASLFAQAIQRARDMVSVALVSASDL